MKKGIFTIAVLAISIINLILNIIIVFTMLPGIKSTDTLVKKITTLVDLDAGYVNTKDPGEVSLDDLEGLDYEATVTLAISPESTKFKYVKITAYISLNKTVKDYATKKATFEDKSSITVSMINEVVSQYTADNVLSNKEKIRTELLKKLQEKFGDTLIYDVSFSEFNVQ